jgi:hypothetical protein
VWNWIHGDESNRWKADDSFLFTLKNPHNIPPRRFALKAEKKHQAICCDPRYGPRFGCDIYVTDNCNTNRQSWSRLGDTYTNDTGLCEYRLCTGSNTFQAKEIEIFACESKIPKT